MPRKENGWGSTRSFSVNTVNNKINKGKGTPRLSGQYPSDRRYGTTITRSLKEQWNIDSTWLRWRKGYEYARQNIWVDLDVLFFAFLFSGTTSRVQANFTCKRFPTLTSDTATRYVVKRTMAPSVIDPRFATVTEVLNNPLERKKDVYNQEMWLKLSPSADKKKSDALYRLIYERVSNKRHGTDYSTTPKFEATVKHLYKNDGTPMVYTATKKSQDTRQQIYIPRDEVLAMPYVAANGLQALVGQVIRMRDMPIAMPQSGLSFEDHPYKITIDMDMTMDNQKYYIINVDGQSPFEVLIDTDDDRIVIGTGDTASVVMQQDYTLEKEFYQQYFDYEFTANTLESETNQMGMIFPPLYINSVAEVGDNIEFVTIPFESQLALYGESDEPYLVLSDFSFGSWQVLENGRTENNMDVKPWEDETFLVGDGIYMSDYYACNCQSYSHSILSSPEAQYRRYSGVPLTKNRQLRYPLPSAASLKDKEALSDSEAGVIVNWATRRDRLSHKCCKHSIGAIFSEQTIEGVIIGGEEIEGIPGTGGVPFGNNKGYYVREPDSYPTDIARDEIETKLVEQTKETDFSESGPRAEISPIDFSFSVLQLLNLMDTEVGSILGGSVAFIPTQSEFKIEGDEFID